MALRTSAALGMVLVIALAAGTSFLWLLPRDEPGTETGSENVTSETRSAKPARAIPNGGSRPAERSLIDEQQIENGSLSDIVFQEPADREAVARPLKPAADGYQRRGVRVRSRESRKPIEAARVEIYQPNRRPHFMGAVATLQGWTDAEGRFEFLQKFDSMKIKVTAEGFASYLNPHQFPGVDRYGGTAAGRSDHLLEIELVSGGTLEGSLRRMDGRPVPGQDVVLSYPTFDREESEYLHSWSATTDSSGKFVIEGLLYDEPFVVEASGDAIPTMRSRPQRMTFDASVHPKTHVVDFEIPHSVDVTGRLRSGPGSDPYALDIWVVDRERSWQSYEELDWTEDDGSFFFPHVPVGEYWLRVCSDDHQDIIEPIPFQVDSQSDSKDYIFDIGLEGLVQTVRGRVLLPGGRPGRRSIVPGLVLTLDGVGYPCDVEGDGTFVLWNIPTGAFTVDVEPGESSYYLEQPVHGPVDGDLIVPLIKSASKLRGTISCDCPADHATDIFAIRNGVAIYEDYGAMGAFETGSMPPGQAMIVFIEEDHPAVEVGPVTIAPGETLDLGHIQITPAATVPGRVLDENGLPVAEASLEVWAPSRRGYHPDPDPRAFAATEADGTFELPLPCKEGWLVVDVDGYPSNILSLKELSLDSLTIRLLRGFTVRGRIQQVDGSRCANVPVEIEVISLEDAMMHGGSDQTFSDEKGDFTFEGLSAGRYIVVYGGWDWWIGSVEVEVRKPLVELETYWLE